MTKIPDARGTLIFATPQPPVLSARYQRLDPVRDADTIAKKFAPWILRDPDGIHEPRVIPPDEVIAIRCFPNDCRAILAAYVLYDGYLWMLLSPRGSKLDQGVICQTARAREQQRKGRLPVGQRPHDITRDLRGALITNELPGVSWSADDPEGPRLARCPSCGPRRIVRFSLDDAQRAE